MFCTHCGNKISDTAKYCTNCGAQIIRTVPQVERTNKVSPVATNIYVNTQPRTQHVSMKQASIEYMLADIRMLGQWCIIFGFLFPLISWVLAGFAFSKCKKLAMSNCDPVVLAANRRLSIIGLCISFVGIIILFILALSYGS